MGIQVSFNYPQWIVRYPEFNYLSLLIVQEYFNEATLYHRNDGGGPVNDANQQSLLLNMLTAHIAKLNAPLRTGQPAPDTVGRVSNASEGSVSVALEFSSTAEAAQWYNQTKYGAAYWAAIRAFRTMRWRRGPIHPVNPFFFR